MRPANIVTAVSDVLAGIAISGFLLLDMEKDVSWQPVLLLCLSTIGLYGGGVVFNDVFDAELDKKERPERPIPRGDVTINQASILGLLLLVGGILAAFRWQLTSGLLATGIAVAALVYDKYSKHHKIAGPLNMGLCRGLNLLLGISVVPLGVQSWWWLGTIPIIYIAAITLISRGEVHGGSRKHIYLAAVMYAAVIISIALFAGNYAGQENLNKKIGWGWDITNFVWWKPMAFTILFLALFSMMIYIPLVKAMKQPNGPNIGKSVKAGVLGLILMNASWACAVGQLPLAFIMLLLLPLSIILAKAFAVT